MIEIPRTGYLSRFKSHSQIEAGSKAESVGIGNSSQRLKDLMLQSQAVFPSKA